MIFPEGRQFEGYITNKPGPTHTQFRLDMVHMMLNINEAYTTCCYHSNIVFMDKIIFSLNPIFTGKVLVIF